MKPITKEQAIAAAAAGESYRDVARRAGVSAPTIGRWLRAASPSEPAPPTPAPPSEPPAGVVAKPELTGEGSTLDKTRAMQRYQFEVAQQALADGNASAAQRAMRDAAGLANTIARLEREERESGDGVTISKAEADDILKGMNERFAAILSRPLLCANCSRELSVSYGGKGVEKDEQDNGV